MSESGLGLIVAATRQNGGNWLNEAPCGPPRPAAAGGTNVPAATVSASVIVVLGNTSDASRSHGAGVDGGCGRSVNARTAMAGTDATGMSRRIQ